MPSRHLARYLFGLSPDLLTCKIYNCPALGFYLEKAVHVGFHIRDGHPLHDDIRDPPLQGLPFVTSHSGAVNTSCAPVRRPAHAASLISKLFD